MEGRNYSNQFVRRRLSHTLHLSPHSVKNAPLSKIIEITEEPECVQSQKSTPQSSVESSTSNSLKLGLRKYFKCIGHLCKKSNSSLEDLRITIPGKKLSEMAPIIQKKENKTKFLLPPQIKKQKVLVLDLWGTLVLSTLQKPSSYDIETEINIVGNPTKMYTKKRFGLDNFLFEMSQLFEIIVLSEENKKTTDLILDQIDPKGRISHRLYRQHCFNINGKHYLKSCRILGRSMDQLVIIDDSPANGLLQPKNYYQIQEFRGNHKDRQICHLSGFLKHVAAQETICCISEQRRRYEKMEIQVGQPVGCHIPTKSHLRSSSSMSLMKNQECSVDEESTQSSNPGSEKENQ